MREEARRGAGDGAGDGAGRPAEEASRLRAGGVEVLAESRAQRAESGVEPAEEVGQGQGKFARGRLRGTVAEPLAQDAEPPAATPDNPEGAAQADPLMELAGDGFRP